MAAPKPRRYAIAALQLALENEGISRWEQDIARAADVLSDDDVRALLVAPQVSDEAKAQRDYHPTRRCRPRLLSIWSR